MTLFNNLKLVIIVLAVQINGIHAHTISTDQKGLTIVNTKLANSEGNNGIIINTAPPLHSKLLPSNRIDATLPNYKGKNNQFDDIYEQDGKLIILEAKGTSAATPGLSGKIDPNDNKIRHMQGTRRYTELVIDKMEQHSEKLTGTKQLQLQGTVAKLRDHLNNNTLEYKMVIQNIDKKTGELGPVTIKDYDQKK